MDRRTFLLRGSAAFAATALAAVLPKQAAAVPAAPKPPLLHRYRDAIGMERLETVPESPTTTFDAYRHAGDAEWSSWPVEFDQDAPVMHILGGEVKIDRFIMHDYVPQPRALYLRPDLLAKVKALGVDSFYGVPLASTYVGYTPQATMLHWRGRAAAGGVRLQGTARRRLLRGR